MKTRTLAMLSLSLSLLMAASAYSQTAPTMVRAKIPFPFSAAGKVLPAGQYEFTPDSGATAVRITGSDKGAPAVLQLISTRLAAGIHTTREDAHVVFDKVGNDYTLSEIWIPGFDGYQLNAVKGTHEHAVIDVPIK